MHAFEISQSRSQRPQRSNPAALERVSRWICLGWILAALAVRASAGDSLVRSLPEHYLPQQPFQITLQVTPDALVRVYAVEEVVPANWITTQISDGGFLDSISGKIKWGPYFDSLPRQLTYQLTPNAQPDRIVQWDGQAGFDGRLVAATGDVSSSLPDSVIVASLPDFYVSGALVNVALSVTPDPTVRVYSVEEEIPDRWTVGTIAFSGVFDAANHRIKWGPFFDAQPRQLTYSIRSPLGDLGTYTLNGVGRFDALEHEIGGERVLQPQPSTVRRSLPGHHTAGVGFRVTNTVVVANWVQTYAIEDRLPTGWVASNMTSGGVFDASLGRVKWGPFTDNTSRTFAYTVTPTGGIGQFDGQAQFNQRTVPIDGDSTSVPFQSQIVRSAPEFFQAGVPFSVTNHVVPAPGVHVYAVEETIQFGWTVASMNLSGVLDSQNGKMKWGPFSDGLTRDLVYVLIPPSGLQDPVSFTGGGRFDSDAVLTVGDQQSRPFPNSIVRVLPNNIVPQTPFTVKVQVDPDPDVKSYAIEETIPPGWSVGPISNQGVFDPNAGKIKWGPFLDNTPRDLTYQLTPPSGNGEVKGIFEGNGVFNGIESPTQGDDFARASGSGGNTTVQMTIRNLSETQIQVEVDGIAGVSYSVESSTDLVTWTLWRTGIANSSGVLLLNDSILAVARFYRVH